MKRSEARAHCRTILFPPPASQMFKTSPLTTLTRSHTHTHTSALLEIPGNIDLGFDMQKLIPQTLAANVPNTEKKKKTRNDEDPVTRWRSPLQGSGATLGVAQPAHFCTCLLHHLTVSHPTQGRAKGLSRASYQGSV